MLYIYTVVNPLTDGYISLFLIGRLVFEFLDLDLCISRNPTSRRKPTTTHAHVEDKQTERAAQIGHPEPTVRVFLVVLLSSSSTSTHCGEAHAARCLLPACVSSINLGMLNIHIYMYFRIDSCCCEAYTYMGTNKSRRLYYRQTTPGAGATGARFLGAIPRAEVRVAGHTCMLVCLMLC